MNADLPSLTKLYNRDKIETDNKTNQMHFLRINWLTF